MNGLPGIPGDKGEPGGPGLPGRAGPKGNYKLKRIYLGKSFKKLKDLKV